MHQQPPRETHRVHPRDRDFLRYNEPSHYWSHSHHCYGHRVTVLPVNVVRHVWRGCTYYCYNDIWYRPYCGYYIVCRPPFGTVLAANIVADMAWTAVNMAYYSTVARTYSQIAANNQEIALQNRIIAQNNEIIAQNNEIIAAQNAEIASGQDKASASYALAERLGLVQSYAYAGSTYYYQDGLFYVQDQDGHYKVIIPPAGALVENLPDDYDVITLAGEDYYKVDETVYKVTINAGKPYFEVIGQMYS